MASVNVNGSFRRLPRACRSFATFVCALLGLFCCSAVVQAQSQAPKPDVLKIFFVDVEGGQATLFVTPKGQSMLVDTGWPGHQGRDADRIVAAAKSAGIQKIDYVLITHFHEDHVGGAPQLAERFPVGTFIDHGENRESTDAPTMQVWQAYQQLLATGKYKHITAKPGKILPVQGMRAMVISADGAVIDRPLIGAGQRIQAVTAPRSLPRTRPKMPDRWEF